MSDIEIIREALAQLDPFKTGRAFAALDRLVAAREAWKLAAGEWRARAEKAERALAKAKQSRTGVYEDKLTLGERVEVAEMRLAAARAALRPSEDTSDES